jgi:signal transduction histidine kinase
MGGIPLKTWTTRNLYGLEKLHGGLLALFTLLILLVLNLSAWWIYWKISRHLDEIFTRSLEESAQLAAIAIANRPAMFLPAPHENSVEYLEQQTFLLQLQAAGSFNDLYLTDPELRNIAGIFSDFQIGRVGGLLALDREYIEKALRGETALTPGEEFEGLLLRTAYTPIPGPLGQVEGLLVVKANVEYHKPKKAVRNTLIIISIMNAVLIVVFALVYWKTLRALRRTEARIVQNDRLASLGQLAAGIAHELRNPLNIIEQTVTVLRRRYEKEPDELFEYIPDEITRMNSIITQFLDSARETPLDRRASNLADVLERTLSLLNHRIKESEVKVETAIPGKIPADIDPGKMQQVFLNLCLNALEALPEKNPELKISVEINKPSGHISITVADNGRGMNPRQIDRIFDPFYTNKEGGAGLGLWVTDRIVHQHEGRIDVVSTPGAGTRMTVILPLGKDEAKNALDG